MFFPVRRVALSAPVMPEMIRNIKVTFTDATSNHDPASIALASETGNLPVDTLTALLCRKKTMTRQNYPEKEFSYLLNKYPPNIIDANQTFRIRDAESKEKF